MILNLIFFFTSRIVYDKNFPFCRESAYTFLFNPNETSILIHRVRTWRARTTGRTEKVKIKLNELMTYTKRINVLPPTGSDSSTLIMFDAGATASPAARAFVRSMTIYTLQRCSVAIRLLPLSGTSIK